MARKVSVRVRLDESLESARSVVAARRRSRPRSPPSGSCQACKACILANPSRALRHQLAHAPELQRQIPLLAAGTVHATFSSTQYSPFFASASGGGEVDAGMRAARGISARTSRHGNAQPKSPGSPCAKPVATGPDERRLMMPRFLRLASSREEDVAELGDSVLLDGEEPALRVQIVMRNRQSLCPIDEVVTTRASSLGKSLRVSWKGEVIGGNIISCPRALTSRAGGKSRIVHEHVEVGTSRALVGASVHRVEVAEAQARGTWSGLVDIDFRRARPCPRCGRP